MGVLKAGSISLKPPLPVCKQSAIQRPGYGVRNKVLQHAGWLHSIAMSDDATVSYTGYSSSNHACGLSVCVQLQPHQGQDLLDKSTLISHDYLWACLSESCKVRRLSCCSRTPSGALPTPLAACLWAASAASSSCSTRTTASQVLQARPLLSAMTAAHVWALSPVLRAGLQGS